MAAGLSSFEKPRGHFFCPVIPSLLWLLLGFPLSESLEAFFFGPVIPSLYGRCWAFDFGRAQRPFFLSCDTQPVMAAAGLSIFVKRRGPFFCPVIPSLLWLLLGFPFS
ncbi:hypothetical protein CY35_08G129100 [Sphagnum magellanicum]|nr:hypothetical protein CY35_08G129100 [Sphagnum magellanicum]